MTGRRALRGFPVNLLVSGRRCVVVGAGRIAERKIANLLDAGADDVHVIAPWACEAVEALAAEGRVALELREFAPTDLDDTWLAITATDVPAVNAAVYAAGQERRVWVNSADDPANCAYTLVSVVRRSDITVTIGTGGRSPALATWLRKHVQQEMGPEYEVLLDLLSEAREELRASGQSSEDADWQAAFSSGIVDLVRAGRTDEAKELLRSCL
ncbi:MAG: precorrin-2 dehydrogenase/sirohydrochlorin ferrochelatase family protein [Acidimicrobiia bacterium]